MPRSLSQLRAVFCGALFFAVLGAGAQSYPNRPITIVHGAAPNTAVDVYARIFSQELRDEWGMRMIKVTVQAMPGDAGEAAARHVAAARPDGYTLFFGNFLKAGFPDQPTHRVHAPSDELHPVAPVAGNAFVLVVHPGSGVSNAKGLLELARRGPDRVTVSDSSAFGRWLHLQLESATGARHEVLTLKKSATESLENVIAGRATLSFEFLPIVKGDVRAGRVNAILVTSPERMSELPSVPTAREAGMPQLESVSWMGLFVPPNTPPEVFATLGKVTRSVLARQNFREQMALGGAYPATDAVVARMSRDEAAKWSRMLGGSREAFTCFAGECPCRGEPKCRKACCR